MARNLIVATVVAAVMAGFVLAYVALVPTQAQPMADMGGAAGQVPRVPPVQGFAEGQEIFFIHTEASDPKIAEMLTRMMSSPVIVVPSLAQAPESARADVFVFANGVKGSGPFGFQADVFGHPPGDPGYTPLRTVNLVEWKNPDQARVLRSVAEVQEAQAKGEIAITKPGAVVNMPFLTWPVGRR